MAGTNGTTATQPTDRSPLMEIVQKLTAKPKTKDYRIGAILPGWGYEWPGTVNFNLREIDQMRKDEQVKSCLRYKKSPLFTAEFDVKTSSPRVEQFVRLQLERFWKKSLGVALKCYDYGFVGAEVLYKMTGGLLHFDALKFLHPFHTRAWTQDGMLKFIRVNGGTGGQGTVDLPCAQKRVPAKGVWFVNEPEQNPWYGCSILEAAWWPWRLKSMPDGGRDIVHKWFYRHAYSGMIVRYPDNQETTDGSEVSDQGLADQIASYAKTGANLSMPSARDPNTGEYYWNIDSYGKIEGDATGLLAYMDALDKWIQRGIEIPDELITHEGNTGGYSRSRVALAAFFLAAEEMLNRILESFDDQILRPLVRLVFGRAEYVIKPKPLRPPEDQGQGRPGEGGQARGDGEQRPPDGSEGPKTPSAIAEMPKQPPMQPRLTMSLGDKTSIEEELLACVAAFKDIDGAGPDYQRLFWNPETKTVWWESADGDESEAVAEIVRRLKKLAGVKDVHVEPEAGPPRNESGWVKFPKQPRLAAQMSAGLFDEQDHPRDEGGKFAEKEGGGGEKAEEPSAETNPESKEPEKKKAYGGRYDDRVAQNMEHMESKLHEWGAVKIKKMVETPNDMGEMQTMPEFEFPSGYSQAPSIYKDDQDSCHLCGHDIKNVYWIQNDEKKWVMPVGSECITRFGEGKSGVKLAKEVVVKANRDFVQEVVQAAADLRAKFTHMQDKMYLGRKIGAVPAWSMHLPGGMHAKRLFDQLNEVRGVKAGHGGISHKLGSWNQKTQRHDPEQPLFSDREIANWVKKNGDKARELLKDIDAVINPKKEEEASKPNSPETKPPQAEESGYLDLLMQPSTEPPLTSHYEEAKTEHDKIAADVANIQEQIKDWESRNYKPNATRVSAESSNEHAGETTMGAANERRRQRRLDSLYKEMDEKKKHLDIQKTRMERLKGDKATQPAPQHPLHSIPIGELSHVEGFPVRRTGESSWRVETPRGHVEGDAAKIQEHLDREKTNQRPERRQAEAALERASTWTEPHPFHDIDRVETEARAFESLPKGTRVVSLDEKTHGRLGQVVSIVDENGRRINRVKLDGQDGYASGHVEPLDPKLSWRVRPEDRPPEPPRLTQGTMFAASKGDGGQWITIGGKHSDEHGKKVGGSPVYVVNGRITKGNPKLTGKTIDALKEDGGDKGEVRTKRLGELRDKIITHGHHGLTAEEKSEHDTLKKEDAKEKSDKIKRMADADGVKSISGANRTTAEVDGQKYWLHVKAHESSQPGSTGRKFSADGGKTWQSHAHNAVQVSKSPPIKVSGEDGAKKDDDPSTHRQQMNQNKGYSRAVWAKKAKSEGVNPQHLHQLAGEMLAHDKANVEDKTAMLQEARQKSKAMGVDLRNLKQRNASGKMDHDALKRFDETAQHIAQAYPSYFTDQDHPEAELYDMLIEGNPEPMGEEDAYQQALDHLMANRPDEEQEPWDADPQRRRQRESEAAIPFSLNFEEGQHPRDPKGEFAKGSSSTRPSHSAETTSEAMRTGVAMAHHPALEGGRAMADAARDAVLAGNGNDEIKSAILGQYQKTREQLASAADASIKELSATLGIPEERLAGLKKAADQMAASLRGTIASKVADTVANVRDMLKSGETRQADQVASNIHLTANDVVDAYHTALGDTGLLYSGNGDMRHQVLEITDKHFLGANRSEALRDAHSHSPDFLKIGYPQAHKISDMPIQKTGKFSLTPPEVSANVPFYVELRKELRAMVAGDEGE